MTVYKVYYYTTGDEWYFNKKVSNKKFKQYLLDNLKKLGLDKDDVENIALGYLVWEKIKVREL